MLRVRTGPECPEDNLRELPEIAAQTVGWLERERKERERELSRKSSNLRHSQTCSQNKELNKHQRSVSWLRTGPSPAGGREAGR